MCEHRIHAHHIHNISSRPQIMSAPTRRAFSRKPGDDAIEVEPIILAEPEPESADSLISINDLDDLENEQTWPTEAEMKDLDQEAGGALLPDAKAGTTPKRVKRIPKGMSEYQAAWIVDSDEEDDEGDHEDAEGDTAGMDIEGHGEAEALEEEEMVMDDLVELESKRGVVTFQDLDIEEETQQCVSHRNPSPYTVSTYPVLETQEMAGSKTGGRGRRTIP